MKKIILIVLFLIPAFILNSQTLSKRKNSINAEVGCSYESTETSTCHYKSKWIVYTAVMGGVRSHRYSFHSGDLYYTKSRSKQNQYTH